MPLILPQDDSNKVPLILRQDDSNKTTLCTNSNSVCERHLLVSGIKLSFETELECISLLIHELFVWMTRQTTTEYLLQTSGVMKRKSTV